MSRSFRADFVTSTLSGTFEVLHLNVSDGSIHKLEVIYLNVPGGSIYKLEVIGNEY